MTSTVRLFAAVLTTGALAFGSSGLGAQQRRPDFAGSWQEDVAASKALTEKMGHEWRVAGAGAGASSASTSPAPGVSVMQPVTVITQTETEIVVELRYEQEVLRRNAHKLDGSESVNATRNSTSRTKTTWKGDALVTTGTTHLDFSDGSARRADGTPISDITRQITTTRRLMPDGTMHVETRTTEDGRERVSYTVFVRVKP